MRHQAASRAPRGMLHVQHFVKQHVRDDVPRHPGPIQASIQQDVIRSGIVAAKLPPPAAMAPADLWPSQFALKILAVQLLKHFLEVEAAPLRTCSSGPDTSSAHLMDPCARAVRAGIFKIRSGEHGWGLVSVNPRQEQRCRTFQYLKWRAEQEVREAHVKAFLASADSQHQAAVGIELDPKARRSPLKTQARKHTLKQSGSAGNMGLRSSHRFRRAVLVPCRNSRHQFFRRNGGGATAFLAFSASFMASRVPSIASSKLSL